jgi:hypothetical protein
MDAWRMASIPRLGQALRYGIGYVQRRVQTTRGLREAHSRLEGVGSCRGQV